jgi:hypothetical protein
VEITLIFVYNAPYPTSNCRLSRNFLLSRFTFDIMKFKRNQNLFGVNKNDMFSETRVNFLNQCTRTVFRDISNTI